MGSLACPGCGRDNTKHTSLEQPDQAPRAGDWTVCLRCSAVCEFGPEPDLIPRLVTQAELDAAEPDVRDQVRRAVRGLALLRAKGNT